MATSPFMPTRREVFLLIALLVSLLFISRTNLLSSSVDPTLKPATRNAEQQVSLVNVTRKPILGIYPEPVSTWTDSIPETDLIAHVPGWSILDRLYVLNGTLFIVSSKPELFPPRQLITSSGYEIFNGAEERKKRLPTDKDIRVVSPSEAQVLFGTKTASRFDGVTFLISDPKQFIAHYYHFSAELLFGIWRTYSSLDLYISPNGQTALPTPRRMVFSHLSTTEWRDYALMNQWVVRGAFPSIGMEFKEDWHDREIMNVPFVFDRVLIADRAAAGEGDQFKATWRTASNAFVLRGSPNWWEPVRTSVLAFSGLASEWINGPDPGSLAERQQYVITYISRQNWGRRMLRQADHERLVEELHKLRDRYGYEVNVVYMDTLSRAEQFQLAGRTTVMMGVHGNGLTSLLWMRPTPRATVIEFFYPKGVAFDYEYTTRALGMVHYGVWNNQTFTRPNVPRYPNYPEGFQGTDIPLDGAVVARLAHKRIMLEAGEEDAGKELMATAV